MDTTVMTTEQFSTVEEAEFQLDTAYRKFTRACDQLLLIDDHAKMVETRYHRAKAAKRQCHQYSMRLQLSSISGLKMMYYTYAMKMADVVEDLKKKIIEMQDDDSEDDEDSEYSFVETSDDE